MPCNFTYAVCVLLTLTLLVLGVLADAHDFALALDDLALLAHGLDAGTYFHVYFLLLVSTAAAPLPTGGKLNYLERQVIRPRVRS